MHLQHPTNHIILHNSGNVNINFFINRLNSENPELSEKWTEKKKLSFKIAQKLVYAGMPERAFRMRNCADIVQMSYCRDCGGFHVLRANLCRDRLCPVCSWRLSLQRFGEMRRMLFSIVEAYPELEYSLLTVTVKNCKSEDLGATLDKMSVAWNRIMQRKCCKANSAGFARSVEITYNANTHEVHPHYHILAAWYKDDSKNMLKAWRESCTKSGLICSYKAQNAQKIHNKEDDSQLLKAVLETYKYNIKGNELDNMPTYIFKNIAKQFSSKKLISFTGIFKKYALLCKINVENVEEGTDLICSDCFSKNVEKIIYQWAFGAYKKLNLSFTPPEDRATLRSDSSVGVGLGTI